MQGEAQRYRGPPGLAREVVGEVVDHPMRVSSSMRTSERRYEAARNEALACGKTLGSIRLRMPAFQALWQRNAALVRPSTSKNIDSRSQSAASSEHAGRAPQQRQTIDSPRGRRAAFASGPLPQSDIGKHEGLHRPAPRRPVPQRRRGRRKSARIVRSGKKGQGTEAPSGPVSLTVENLGVLRVDPGVDPADVVEAFYATALKQNVTLSPAPHDDPRQALRA